MNFLNGNLTVYSEPDTGENVQGASAEPKQSEAEDLYGTNLFKRK